ncbi:3-hydroxyacyl-CoA dehydrogenase family protein [Anaerocolumna sp. AGMB13025]|uniref:3-hydroxyacyl-CoA dehydrogenase family protein n=1 Tax=Anaerocolumna sp. AGMB13025 TaxID=3039116 RepID=UPI00241E1D20|nr:3-hydroxyacyl-CoA dehydrogenase family protein [Anaerocolumna sp. AGMB13025]WFR56029.1 3-hydroxyacyl-CoA dehydrogenase family protein [Anaerocolumna sp. AGMB13025]
MNVGVIGAGTMGRGIAQTVAQYNEKVVLVDISTDILESAKKEIRNSVRMQAFYNKALKGIKPDEVIERIIFTTDYALLAECDFIIENVPEKLEIKIGVYEQLEKVSNPSAYYAVNTSCIPVTEIAALTNRPDKVIGMHFMNPVPMIEAVEIMKGFHTSKETIEAALKLLKAINKHGIIVNDYPGFVSNRISHLMMNEAAFIVQEGEASIENVDDIFKKCYGHKMGPLETADLIGLDTVVDSLDVLFGQYKDTKFRCCPLLRRMVAAGHCGRKSGQGFYGYNG